MSESAPTPGDSPSFAERQAHDVRRLLFAPGTDASAAAIGERSVTGNEQSGGEGGADRVVVPPFRVVVATDFASESFSATTVPVAVLRAFAQMFGEGEPVNLVFAVAHEAGETDVLGAQSLLGQLTTTRALAGVAIESFAEAELLPAYVAVVPTGDPHLLVDELTSALMGMHLLAETIANPGRLRIALAHQHLLSRRRRDDALAHRLAAYREVHLRR